MGEWVVLVDEDDGGPGAAERLVGAGSDGDLEGAVVAEDLGEGEELGEYGFAAVGGEVGGAGFERADGGITAEQRVLKGDAGMKALEAGLPCGEKTGEGAAVVADDAADRGRGFVGREFAYGGRGSSLAEQTRGHGEEAERQHLAGDPQQEKLLSQEGGARYRR